MTGKDFYQEILGIYEDSKMTLEEKREKIMKDILHNRLMYKNRKMNRKERRKVLDYILDSITDKEIEKAINRLVEGIIEDFRRTPHEGPGSRSFKNLTKLIKDCKKVQKNIKKWYQK